MRYIRTGGSLKQLMGAEETADYLGLKVTTLANWRMQGKGPSFIRVGKYVRYDRADVDAWLDAQKVSGDAA